MRHILRIFATDIDGSKPIGHALNSVKGISFSMSKVICEVAGVDKNKKAGLLSDEELKRIESVFTENIDKIPSWMLNRQKDYDEGVNKHLLGVDLKLRTEFDIKRMQKIKSYKGMRHAAGLPVRGQRTKGHFRKSKKSLGVKRKKK